MVAFVYWLHSVSEYVYLVELDKSWNLIGYGVSVITDGFNVAQKIYSFLNLYQLVFCFTFVVKVMCCAVRFYYIDNVTIN